MFLNCNSSWHKNKFVFTYQFGLKTSLISCELFFAEMFTDGVLYLVGYLVL
jgi:hypothetical protein